MDDKNVEVLEEVTPQCVPNGLLKMAIYEYGLPSIVGVGLVTLLGATIGGLIGIKLYIK